MRLRVLLAIAVALFSLATPLSGQNTSDQDEAKELFLVAQKAFDDGFYDVAIRYLQQFQDQFPTHEKMIQAKLILGQCHFFKHQYLKAYSVFQELMSYNEYKDATLYWLGETYFKGADFKQASSHYRQLMSLFPDSAFYPQALYSLAWTHFEQGDYETAQEYFQKLITEFAEHPLAEDSYFKMAECFHQLEKYDLAVEAFLKYLEHFPQSTRLAETYFLMAESFYYSEDFLSAITYYAKADDRAYDKKVQYMSKVSMGWCYFKIGKYDLARRYFMDAETFGKERDLLTEDLFFGKASLMTEQKEYDLALEAYDAILNRFSKSPKVAEAALGRANIFYAQRSFPEAIREFQAIIKQQEPAVKEEIVEKAYYGLAWTYLKDGNPDMAIQTFEEIMSKTQSDIVKVSALTQIANAYFDIEEMQKAIDVYDRILKEYPGSIYADYVQFRQGIALLKLDRIDAARMSFHAVQQNFPQSKYLDEVTYYEAVAYVKKEDWRSAIPLLEEYRETAEAEASYFHEARYLLGLAYFGLKDHTQALAVFTDMASSSEHDKNIGRLSRLYIAKCLLNLKRNEEARKALQDIVSQYPQSDTALEALLLLGEFYFEQQEYAQSVTSYKTALETYPGTEKRSLIAYELGQAYLALENVESALQAFEMIPADQNPEIYGRAKLAIADIFSRDLPPEEALSSYRRIAEELPRFQRDAETKIAEIYLRQGQYPEALSALKRARSAESAFESVPAAKIQFMIADLHEMLNEHASAVEEYLKVPYLYKNDSEWVIKAYLRVGRIFENTEEWEKARLIYEKVLNYKTDESKYAAERLKWIEENVNGP